MHKDSCCYKVVWLQSEVEVRLKSWSQFPIIQKSFRCKLVLLSCLRPYSNWFTVLTIRFNNESTCCFLSGSLVFWNSFFSCWKKNSERHNYVDCTSSEQTKVNDKRVKFVQCLLLDRSCWMLVNKCYSVQYDKYFLFNVSRRTQYKHVSHCWTCPSKIDEGITCLWKPAVLHLWERTIQSDINWVVITD